MFAHDAVLEAVIVGSTEISCGLFKAQLMKWQLTDPKTGKKVMYSQYEV